MKELRALASNRKIEIEAADRRKLDDIAHSEAHQGVIAYVGPRKYWELEPMARAALDERPNAVLLMLDSLQDPQNLGTISRTAEATGVGGIITSHNRSPEITPSVVKASAGAAEHLRYSRIANLAQAIDSLKQLGFWIVGLAAEAAVSYTDFDYRRPLVLVVGAEGEGLHELLRKKADALVSLPMAGKVSSLNAAVAGSILLYEVIRQRTAESSAR